MRRSAIVIGAGIAGLATARALAVRDYRVTVIERSSRAVGASVRNFGMIWPVGQPDGELYEQAMISRSIWKETCDEAGIWYDEVGSLHLAHAGDEWVVLQELAQAYTHRHYRLLNRDEVLQQSPVAAENNLIGGLFSPHELIVDPRQAIAAIPSWLSEKYNVRFIYDRAVTDVCYPAVYSGSDTWEADEIFICSGADFETLYPQLYSMAPLTKCKLQMMRLAAQPGDFRIGPAVCGALSLVHYNAFKVAPSLANLKSRFENEYADYLEWGIHVMVSQNQAGELTVGDSHEYALTHDPFDKHFINEMILGYLKKFARLPDETVTETWNGIYPKLTNGQPHLVLQPEKGVTIINGLGGAGMTLSFGLCEQLISRRAMIY